MLLQIIPDQQKVFTSPTPQTFPRLGQGFTCF